MTCTGTCRKPHGNQAHCGAECHQTFSTVGVFDHHRTGPVGERRCADPTERGMHLDAYGVWREGGTRPRYWDAPAADAVPPQGCETGSVVPSPTPDDPRPADSLSGGWGDYPRPTQGRGSTIERRRLR